MSAEIEARLKDLGVTLPQAATPVANYVPYVNSGSMDVLPQEYRHEPQLALAGGADGMDLVRRILQAAPRYLSENGVLVLEIGHERDFFEAAFPELSPVWLDTEQASDQLLLLTREQLTT